MKNKTYLFMLLGISTYSMYCVVIYQVLAKFHLNLGSILLAFLLLASSKIFLDQSLKILDKGNKNSLFLRILYFFMYFFMGLGIILFYRQNKPIEIIHSGLYNSAYNIFLGLTMTFAFHFLVRYFFKKDIEEMGWGRKKE